MDAITIHVNQSLLNPYPTHDTLWTRICGFCFLVKCLKYYLNNASYKYILIKQNEVVLINRN